MSSRENSRTILITSTHLLVSKKWSIVTQALIKTYKKQKFVHSWTQEHFPCAMNATLKQSHVCSCTFFSWRSRKCQFWQFRPTFLISCLSVLFCVTILRGKSMNNRKFVFFSNQVTGINMKIIPVSRKIVNDYVIFDKVVRILSINQKIKYNDG